MTALTVVVYVFLLQRSVTTMVAETDPLHVIFLCDDRAAVEIMVQAGFRLVRCRN
jgi:hypothetical protein